MNKIKKKVIRWYKDKKLMIAFIIVAVSIVLGIYSKALLFVKFYEPISVITGLSLYTFSWLLLFLGIFLVGWRAVKMMRNRIHHHVKKTVRKTYHHARKLPKQATHYTKKLHKRSMNKLRKTSKIITKNYH